MKFLIVEKVHEHRHDLIQVVKELDNEATIVVTDSVYGMFSNLAKIKDFDYILLDFTMLGSEWRRQIKRLCEEKNQAKFAFFSDITDVDLIYFLFSLGCEGCIPGNCRKEIIHSALFLIMNGYRYIPPSILAFAKEGNSSVKNYRLPDGKTLTPRQVEVLGFLSKGLSNKQIAFEMSVSEATVKLHMNALLKNLDVNNRTQAVLSAQKFGFI
jgi:DNA-binding NarL/FixJ family response regulator